MLIIGKDNVQGRNGWFEATGQGSDLGNGSPTTASLKTTPPSAHIAWMWRCLQKRSRLAGTAKEVFALMPKVQHCFARHFSLAFLHLWQGWKTFIAELSPRHFCKNHLRGSSLSGAFSETTPHLRSDNGT